jgi:hypothetical protein
MLYQSSLPPCFGHVSTKDHEIIDFIDSNPVGHIPPTHRAAGDAVLGLPNGTQLTSLFDMPKSPILLQGNATVTEIFTQARLEVRIPTAAPTQELTVPQ